MLKPNSAKINEKAKPNSKGKPNTIHIARDYLRRGWQPRKVPHGEKSPIHDEWQKDKITFANVVDHFTRWDNIGVQFGPMSNNLCDVDLDCREARELASDFLPETQAKFGRKSSPCSHWLYNSNAWETVKAASTFYDDPIKSDDEHGVRMVELRTGRIDHKGEVRGAQSLFPPSTHPSGETVEWVVDGKPATVDGDFLKRAVAELGVATLMARHWPKGKRNEAGMTLAGVLARHAGMDAEEIEVFVGAVARVAGAEDWEQRGRDASRAAQRLKDGEEVRGWPKMQELWGKEITDAVSKWLGVSHNTGQSTPDYDHKAQGARNGASRDESIDALIAELAEYSGIDYELTLTEVAKKIKVPKPAIREAVEKFRATKRDTDDDVPPPPTLEELAERSAEIIACKDVLGLFAKVYGKLVAGETEIGKILYLNSTTRLFEKANHTAIKGPSAGGKSYERTESLKFMPPEDVISFTSMSEKALLYMPEGFEHKILSMGEAINTDEQTFQDYLLRELMSESKLRYPVVQKDEHGNLVTVIIEKNGPVAFMVTTTKNKLHPENETRMLSLEINDSEEQTKRVMAKIAQRVGRNRTELNIDLAPWHDFQRWLKAGDLTVDIPFAGILSDLIPPKAVRLRRDFEQLLRAVHAHALLHRAHRKRDDKGRIVATIADDYEPVRALLGDVMATGAEVKLAKTMVDTVQAIMALTAKQSDHDESGFLARDIAAELKLDHSTTWRRLQAAVWADYVINLEERKGRPGRYRAKPLTDDQAKREVLPTCEQLRAELRRRNEERRK